MARQSGCSADTSPAATAASTAEAARCAGRQAGFEMHPQS